MRGSVVLVMLALAAASACTRVSDPAMDDNPLLEVLTRHWVHSYEEEISQSDMIELYRPDGYKPFAPSWFRMQYVFKRNGTCEWMELAPNDAHTMKPGTWTFDAEHPDVIHIRQAGRTVTYRIIELTAEKLRMEKLAVD